MATIKAGTVLAFCGGEWSDKWTTGPFNVLRDIEQAEVVKAYRNAFVASDEWDTPDEGGFMAWLSANGYIEDVEESYLWYIGAYCDFEPVIA